MRTMHAHAAAEQPATQRARLRSALPDNAQRPAQGVEQVELDMRPAPGLCGEPVRSGWPLSAEKASCTTATRRERWGLQCSRAGKFIRPEGVTQGCCTRCVTCRVGPSCSSAGNELSDCVQWLCATGGRRASGKLGGMLRRRLVMRPSASLTGASNRDLPARVGSGAVSLQALAIRPDSTRTGPCSVPCMRGFGLQARQCVVEPCTTGSEGCSSYESGGPKLIVLTQGSVSAAVGCSLAYLLATPEAHCKFYPFSPDQGAHRRRVLAAWLPAKRLSQPSVRACDDDHLRNQTQALFANPSSFAQVHVGFRACHKLSPCWPIPGTSVLQGVLMSAAWA